MRLQTVSPQQTSSTAATTATNAARAFWPDAVAYREAIQNPAAALADPQLSRAQVAVGRQGLPIAYAGRFAVVFRLRTGSGGGDWALRCFTSRGAEDERRAHYALLAPRLAALPETFVPFRYLEQGVRVGGNWYPALAMRWAEGETLGRFVEDHRHDPDSLRNLSQSLADLLERLEAAGIGHGDWQHDNILVADNGKQLTLVDYDGVFVPELSGQPAPEIGHANYQHPARTRSDFGPGLDRFSHLVIQTALHALIADPTLCDRFPLDDALLFHRADFTAPLGSPIFNAIQTLAARDAALAERLSRLKVACASGRAGMVLSEPVPPVPAAVPAPDPKKWWLTAEATTVKKTKTAKKAATPPQPQAVSTGATNYLEQIQTPKTEAAEQRNLWSARLLWLIGLIGTLGWYAADGRDWVLFSGSVLFLLSQTACYMAWPRKSLLDELETKIVIFSNISSENQVVIKRLRKRLDKINTVRVNMTADEYVADRLSQVSVRRAGVLSGIGRTTVKRLENAQIHTAADVEGRLDAVLISPRRRELVQIWYDDLKEEAIETYVRATHHRRSIEDPLRRLEDEEAVRKAQLKDLRAQRRRFPDTSVGSYARRVLGIVRT